MPHRSARAISAFAKKPIVLAVRAVGAVAMLSGGLASAAPAPASAGASSSARPGIEEVVVTATRRSESVQDVPINIAALSGDSIEQQGLTDIADIAAFVPGLHVVDQGARGASRIVVRGLNADPSAASEQLNNGSGGTVATYVGEVPFYVDLRLADLERVEVLLGPQGTLYGAGTLGGAIRYIPRKPEFSDNALSVRGEGFGYSEADDPGYRAGVTGNLALTDNLALRVVVDRHDDPGFIDYNYVVREIGVSDPDPNFSNASQRNANLKSVKDANDSQITSSRVAVRWAPIDALDGTLTYYFQKSEAGGRTINHRASVNTDDYEAAARVLEPNERDNKLLALELTADLGFAELTSATGASRFEEHGQRDQTDLLITLGFSYEAFPSFTAFTREDSKEKTFNQELRLVSTTDGPFSWIVGGYYNTFHQNAQSREFTPLYDTFLSELDAGDGDGGGPGGALDPRPDDLEYVSIGRGDLTERAVYGEVSYAITPEWQVTLGGRLYKYKLESEAAVDLPLSNTVFNGAAPDAINLVYEPANQDDDGSLFKFNTSYQVNDDLLVYATVSEGYRIGAANAVGPCPDVAGENQAACALPNERDYSPDTTTNFELGVHSSWLDGELILNGAVFYVDWSDPQLAATTKNGQLPITTNGKGAESTGLELSGNWRISDSLSVRGSYSYSKAELTDPAKELIATIPASGFATVYVDGQDGDRLPGSPEHQGSVFVAWQQPVFDAYTLELNYGISGVSDVLTRTGKRGNGEALDGYVVQNASATLLGDNWTATLFVDNLANKYAETSARQTRAFVRQLTDAGNGPVAVRRYYKDVLAPRMFGLRFSFALDGGR